ncbi:hypothetical protein COLINT_03433 [Collinsella intestinalis DSM 13280]|uniref:Uncharacterized protein n=1 Tax=Collinsella intestinalis DSM 13280 TaxID=521003 RepID=C4FBI0_9ACTN|nr:hypothetical protein COLINT_03433 [Collinsella intestinalis DSM 13280]
MNSRTSRKRCPAFCVTSFGFVWKWGAWTAYLRIIPAVFSDK